MIYGTIGSRVRRAETRILDGWVWCSIVRRAVHGHQAVSTKAGAGLSAAYSQGKRMAIVLLTNIRDRGAEGEKEKRGAHAVVGIMGCL